jgi:ribosomal protein S18 acetylase RimI-like enzyme
MTTFSIRPLAADDAAWVRQFTVERWGVPVVVAHGQVYEPERLPGFAAFDGGEVIGLLTYQVAGDACEVVTLDSLREGVGVGSALIAAAADVARRAGCARLWLITTNDNLNALGFYQKRGFRLVAVHRGAVDRARAIKPAIPLIGEGGIPLHDEIELEMRLDVDDDS